MPCSDCGEVISYCDWGFSGFPNSFQANACGSSMIRLWSLHFKSFWIYYSVILPLDAVSGCTSPGRHVFKVTEFCRVVPNIWTFSVWNLHDVILLVPRILKCLLEFWKICVPLCYVALLTGSWNNTCGVCILQYDGYDTCRAHMSPAM